MDGDVVWFEDTIIAGLNILYLAVEQKASLQRTGRFDAQNASCCNLCALGSRLAAVCGINNLCSGEFAYCRQGDFERGFVSAIRNIHPNRIGTSAQEVTITLSGKDFGILCSADAIVLWFVAYNAEQCAVLARNGCCIVVLSTVFLFFRRGVADACQASCKYHLLEIVFPIAPMSVEDTRRSGHGKQIGIGC